MRRRVYTHDEITRFHRESHLTGALICFPILFNQHVTHKSIIPADECDTRTRAPARARIMRLANNFRLNRRIRNSPAGCRASMNDHLLNLLRDAKRNVAINTPNDSLARYLFVSSSLRRLDGV
jgi:hypothetical protein